MNSEYSLACCYKRSSRWFDERSRGIQGRKGVIALGGIIPMACAVVAFKKPKLVKTLVLVGALCAIVGAVCLRVAFIV